MILCCRILVVLFLLATAVSTLRVYPHQLAYFNELAGGPDNGWKHLLHSNLDWGQDWLYAKKWWSTHGASCAHLTHYGIATYNPADIDFNKRHSGTHNRECDSDFLAIGATCLQRRTVLGPAQGDLLPLSLLPVDIQLPIVISRVGASLYVIKCNSTTPLTKQD